MILIIALIAIAIFGKFIYDRYILLEDIDSNGGLLLKYKVLVDYMLSRTGGNITRKNKDYLEINYFGKGVTTHFTIVPGFNKVIVQWKFSCEPLASFSHKWEFDEGKVSYTQMVSQIDQDIEIKTQSFLKDFPKVSPKLEKIVIETSTPEPQSKVATNDETSAITTLIVDNLIKHLFLPLDKQGKAFVLSMFMQIEHNNPYVDKLYNDNNEMFLYSEYEMGYNYFLEILEIDISTNGFVFVLKSITNYSELSRLTAILLAVQGDFNGCNEHLKLATEAWEKSKSEGRYVYNLLKTKLELFIFFERYFEAASLCEKVWPSLQSEEHLQSVGWLKYQFARAIVIVSKKVMVNLSIDLINESLDSLEEKAISEHA